MTAERLIASPAVIFGFANALNVSFPIPTVTYSEANTVTAKAMAKNSE